MKSDATRLPQLERLLTQLLDYGTWLASAMIALGLALAYIKGGINPSVPAGMPIVTVGIALFISLPVLRVIFMLIFFIKERDYRFIAITATVLLFLALGLTLGARKL